MSSLATFTQLPRAALAGLLEAASARPCRYHAYLRQHGKEAIEWNWSGHVLAALLPFLRDEGIELEASEYDELASRLQNAMGVSPVILTPAHKRECLIALERDFSRNDLRHYYSRLYASDEDAAEPMLDGIRALRDALRLVDEDTVVRLDIG